MAIFEGAGVALVTPFKENGEVNYEKLCDCPLVKAGRVSLRIPSLSAEPQEKLPP